MLKKDESLEIRLQNFRRKVFIFQTLGEKREKL